MEYCKESGNRLPLSREDDARGVFVIANGANNQRDSRSLPRT